MEKKKQMVSASVQPKNGRLYAVIWCRHGPDGKEKPVWRALGLDESTRASIVNKRLREVTNEFEAKINSETEAPPEADLPIYDYMAKWLNRTKKNYQANTYRSYQNMIEGKIKRYFREHEYLTVGTVKAKDIDDFYAHLFSGGVTGNTVIHYHAVLHKAFAYAFKDEIISANPFDRVERPKKNKFHGQSYSEEELRALLNLAKDDPIYPAVVLASCLGLRRSEALGARWSRVNWDDKTILIDTKIVEIKNGGKAKIFPMEEMKNKTSKRTLALPQPVIDMLLEYRARADMYKKMFKGGYNREYEDYVCVDQLGDLLTRPT